MKADAKVLEARARARAIRLRASVDRRRTVERVFEHQLLRLLRRGLVRRGQARQAGRRLLWRGYNGRPDGAEGKGTDDSHY